MEIIVFLAAIWGAVALYGGIDDDTVMTTDPRWNDFDEQRQPLVAERNAALTGFRQLFAECIAALDNGDRPLAENLAQQAHDMASRAHASARSIERLARELLVTPPQGYKNVREATSRAIGKLQNSIARESFEKLLADLKMPPDEASRLMDLIVVSPDCAMYATLTSERVLGGQRFLAAEEKIAASGEYSYHYSQILGRRFEKGEASIQATDRLWGLYAQRHALPPFLGLNPHVCTGCGQGRAVCACGNTLV